ncbi:MAG: DUF3341 domain-containing protein [Candidatus Hydrogenedentes bacterium]|nr:DUF3341 domain-containing protein [Candidatus Hydrogenedentota bacterium]MBI3118985.1 DUF3341 domain-containing protein [Candidatus Hydrogenedentota bacterium]
MAEHNQHDEAPKVYGLIAEFDEVEQLLHAARAAYRAGYRELDAFSPFPIHGLAESIGFRKTWVSFWTLVGGLTGTATAFLLQYISMVLHYPYMASGKPLNSWPSWVPVIFELTILFGAFSALGSMLFLNGLPQPYHPVFNAKRFERASSDGFFLCIETTDAQYDSTKTREFLQGLHPVEVSEVMD